MSAAPRRASPAALAAAAAVVVAMVMLGAASFRRPLSPADVAEGLAASAKPLWLRGLTGSEADFAVPEGEKGSERTYSFFLEEEVEEGEAVPRVEVLLTTVLRGPFKAGQEVVVRGVLTDGVFVADRLGRPWDKEMAALATIFFGGAILWMLGAARRGEELFVRQIPGLDAVDEAIGRATEMGKAVLYCPGLSSAADVATLASLNILGRVARRVANYETRLIVPHRDPIVMSVAREVLKDAYLQAGKPELYVADDNFYITEQQFAYTAAVNGIMVRDRPATVFLMGMFYAESLLLAETGNSIGAIQIAGTDATHQLPFFIAACDYTLIGEELYAAGAYLSRDPALLSSLKASDLVKGILWLAILAGVVASYFGSASIFLAFNR
ncbi:hypothetical protein IIA16_04115 [bacterium]|nr:hypothetical protein [bacterium]